MAASFQFDEPLSYLVDQLVDSLHLLYECRRRGVTDVDRLIEYIEYTMDEIERRHLGMSGESFLAMSEAQEPASHDRM